jgi:hypothetical protein
LIDLLDIVNERFSYFYLEGQRKMVLQALDNLVFSLLSNETSDATSETTHHSFSPAQLGFPLIFF